MLVRNTSVEQPAARCMLLSGGDDLSPKYATVRDGGLLDPPRHEGGHFMAVSIDKSTGDSRGFGSSHDGWTVWRNREKAKWEAFRSSSLEGGRWVFSRSSRPEE